MGQTGIGLDFSLFISHFSYVIKAIDCDMYSQMFVTVMIVMKGTVLQ